MPEARSQSKVKRLILGSFSSNCYLVFDEKSKETLIVDPGDAADYIERVVSDLGLTPILIVATHGHVDHVLACEELKLAYGISFAASPKDTFLLGRIRHGAIFPTIDRALKEGDEISVGRATFRVIETPGHTPGSICLYSRENKVAFVGDLVFKGGGIGRYDFPYSDKAKLYKSVKKILDLPGKTVFYPGHGEEILVKDILVRWL